MAKASSQKFIAKNRAPRVQIEYDVEVYGSQKKVQLPFVMGVMSDLSGKSAEPLAPVEGVAEVTGRRVRDEHQPARDHGLDERQGRHRHRRDVEDPGDRGDGEADRPPAGPKQLADAVQRPADADLGRLAGSAVLAEHAGVRRGGAGEC